jgi:sugar/nucleoside kinase (ribokinase family)
MRLCAIFNPRADDMARVLCVGHAVEDHVFRRDITDEGRKYQSKGLRSSAVDQPRMLLFAIARLGGDVRLAARVGGCHRSINHE